MTAIRRTCACGRVQPCPVHGRRRRTLEERGYGPEHRRLREALRPVVELGAERCVRCGELIAPGEAWDLDHGDDRRGYRGPAHASCNRAAGGRRV